VQGKYLSQFRLPDGRHKDSRLLVRQLIGLGSYHRHQVVQHAVDHIEVRIIPGRSWLSSDSARIKALVHDYFETPVRVDVRTVSIQDTSPTGKFQDVIIACT
jgi:hypothetical protein